MEQPLNHLNHAGEAHMVDITAKDENHRTAIARAELVMAPATFDLLAAGQLPKGDVMAAARIAGIMAAKRTSELIPLCHPIALTAVDLTIELLAPDRAIIFARAGTTGRTGVEMEAMTAVSIAALTLYDMVKAVDRGLEIVSVRLEEKSGGRSGLWRRGSVSGRIIAINRSDMKGTPKYPVPEGTFRSDWGLEGDAHAGAWHRQVSLLGIESMRKIEALGIKGLCTGRFAENITTEGINLYELPVGTRLKAGACLFEITQIGKECHQHCAIYQQVGDCVMPREGIFVRVLQGGTLRAGDVITVVQAGSQDS